MVNLMELWLPILVSTVICFIASAIIWMALPIHKHDYKDPGDKEGPILDLLRTSKLDPGVYYVPWCGGKDWKDPANQAKLKAGPWAMLTVQAGQPNMGKNLGLWFIHLLIVGILVAYVTSHAGLVSGSDYLKVFRVAGTAALLAHAGGALPACIWMGAPWSHLPGKLIDGVVYALLTAGAFGWLWPHAQVAAN
ncbi:MAG: hypothetical protein AB7Q00_09495 [Phycisphaerales bacterium]|nr:MAG: hypothetical protein IPK69_02110 [Phycisphaerales bacterium]